MEQALSDGTLWKSRAKGDASLFLSGIVIIAVLKVADTALTPVLEEGFCFNFFFVGIFFLL